MTPFDLLLCVLLAGSLAGWLCACAGKALFMPYRCARFTCWRQQGSIYRLCRRHLNQQAQRYAKGRYP